jgi:catechol 2,3-dioxygenase-like lactoylglutathione lyase family enzyme
VDDLDRSFAFYVGVIGFHVVFDRPEEGSVSTRTSNYSRSDEGRDFSSGLRHTQNRCGAAKEVEPAVVGGDLLMDAGSGLGSGLN